MMVGTIIVVLTFLALSAFFPALIKGFGLLHQDQEDPFLDPEEEESKLNGVFLIWEKLDARFLTPWLTVKEHTNSRVVVSETSELVGELEMTVI